MPPSPAADACLLYLVRHGATDNNLADPPLLQGQAVDAGLSAEGLRQAARTAELLSRLALTAVYSSPLRRAQETARAIAQPHGLTVSTVIDLTEADVGQWERRSWVEIAQSEPAEYRRFMEDPATYGYRGGENLTQVHHRVQPVLERLLADNLGGQIAVVGHNVVNRVFLSQVIGLPLSQARSVNQDNCGVTVARYRHGAVKLLTLNAAFHLLD